MTKKQNSHQNQPAQSTIEWMDRAIEGLKRMHRDPDFQKEVATRATSKEKVGKNHE